MARLVTAMSNAIAGSVPARRDIPWKPPAASMDSSGHASDARATVKSAVDAIIGMWETAATYASCSAASMIIGVAPSSVARLVTLSIERSLAVTGGTITQRAPSNSDASAAIGPDSVLPAMGWLPTNPLWSPRYWRAQCITCDFVEPVSVITASGFTTLAIASSIFAIARTGVAMMTTSASRTASSGVAARSVMAPVRCAAAAKRCSRS